MNKDFILPPSKTPAEKGFIVHGNYNTMNPAFWMQESIPLGEEPNLPKTSAQAIAEGAYGGMPATNKSDVDRLNAAISQQMSGFHYAKDRPVGEKAKTDTDKIRKAIAMEEERQARLKGYAQQEREAQEGRRKEIEETRKYLSWTPKSKTPKPLMREHLTNTESNYGLPKARTYHNEYEPPQLPGQRVETMKPGRVHDRESAARHHNYNLSDKLNAVRGNYKSSHEPTPEFQAQMNRNAEKFLHINPNTHTQTKLYADPKASFLEKLKQDITGKVNTKIINSAPLGPSTHVGMNSLKQHIYDRTKNANYPGLVKKPVARTNALRHIKEKVGDLFQRAKNTFTNYVKRPSKWKKAEGRKAKGVKRLKK